MLGTLGVPFSAMFAMTGAYFSLFLVVYGALVVGALGGDAEELRSFLPGIERPAYEASGVAAPPLPFATLFARLPSHWPRIDLVAMEIEGWATRPGPCSWRDTYPARSDGARPWC